MISRERLFATAAAAAAIGFGVSYAANVASEAPTLSTTTIQACVKDDGQVRIVSSAASCKNSETAISWNVVGPAGAQGPAGPAGPTGANGADGAPGTNGRDGLNGIDGAPGVDGADGADGEAGPAGPAGATGAVGPAGPAGPQGPAGEDGDQLLAAAIYGPCGAGGHLLPGYNPNGSPRCASGSTVDSPKVVYKIIPAGGHYYDSDPAVCPDGYKFIGGAARGGATGGVFSSGGAFNADNYIAGAFDNMYVDCNSPGGCVTTCLRMTFY